VETLISNGADVNIMSYGEKAPLHYAAWNGNVRIVDALLKKCANINESDNSFSN